MAAPRVRPTLAIVSAVLLSIASSANGTSLGSVFNTTDVSNPFKMLDERDCLPDDFSFGVLMEVIGECFSNLSSSANADCPNLSLMSLMDVCVAENLNLVNGTSFDADGIISLISGFSSDVEWTNTATELAQNCIDVAAAAAIAKNTSNTSLTEMQQYIAVATCWRWSLFVECDGLDPSAVLDEASCRRVRNLVNVCPFSPKRLLKPLASLSWEQCEEPIIDEQCDQLHTAVTEYLSCLLQDYVSGTDTGSDIVDFDKLQTDIENSGDNMNTTALLSIVEECKTSDDTTTASLGAFIECWRNLAGYLCAQNQAIQFAVEFQPELCP